MKGVHCDELFGGIAHKNHTFTSLNSFFHKFSIAATVVELSQSRPSLIMDEIPGFSPSFLLSVCSWEDVRR